MEYKKITLVLQKEWVDKRFGVDIPVIKSIIEMFDDRNDSEIHVLESSDYDCVFIVKSQNNSKEQLKEYIWEFIENNSALYKNEVDDIAAIKITEVDDRKMKHLFPKKIDFDAEYVSKGKKVKRNDFVVAREFKELIQEFEIIAPQVEKYKTYDVFASQSYLFSINRGCGLTSYLETMADTLGELKLYQCDKAVKFVEKTMEHIIDEKDVQSFIEKLEMKNIKNNKCILCIDISECMAKIKEKPFINLLHKLNEYAGEIIFVFRVPFLEKDALDNIRRALSDLFTVREVYFPPFSTEELVEIAKVHLKEKGFNLENDAVSVLITRISEEKRDGRFYGILTVQKIAREIIYLKHLANAACKTNNTDICRDDIHRLAESYDINEKSGMEQLNDLIGLDSLKKRILEIVTQIEAVKNNTVLENPCIHMQFIGNPGTGKTTVARIIGKILAERGVLRNGMFFEYSGRDFCGRYIGETAPKTSSMCRDAYGSVLFIDEAYSLYNNNIESNDYGKEALTALIAEMENHRNDMLVIMAGYSDDMELLMKGNAGLESRIPYKLEFPNYSRSELCEIFMAMTDENFSYDEDFKNAAEEYFNKLPDEVLKSKTFSNARFARNLYERTWGKAILRTHLDNTGDRMSLKAEDFIQASSEREFTNMMVKRKQQIGFNI